MSLLRRLLRRGGVPRDVARHIGLDRGEAVLASARLDDGATAVATPARLVVADVAGRHLALPWHEVDTAGWEPETRTVDIHLVDGGHRRLTMAGDEGTMLPEVLRERVQSSVVLTSTVEVRGRRGVRVVVRRAPGGLVTQVIPDAGIDPGEPEIARRVALVRAEVEQAAGVVTG